MNCHSFLKTTLAAFCFTAAGLAAPVAANAACNQDALDVIKALNGAWRGSGTVQPIGGSKERVSCRVNYNSKGPRVKQKISCAGTDFKFDADADVACKGNDVTGRFTERVANNTGRVKGNIRNKQLKIDISSPNFDGRFAVKVANRSKHSLTITQFDPGAGRHVPVATIALRR